MAETRKKHRRREYYIFYYLPHLLEGYSDSTLIEIGVSESESLIAITVEL